MMEEEAESEIHRTEKTSSLSASQPIKDDVEKQMLMQSAQHLVKVFPGNSGSSLSDDNCKPAGGASATTVSTASAPASLNLVPQRHEIMQAVNQKGTVFVVCPGGDGRSLVGVTNSDQGRPVGGCSQDDANAMDTSAGRVDVAKQEESTKVSRRGRKRKESCQVTTVTVLCGLINKDCH